MSRNEALALAGFLAACFAVEILASTATMTSVREWYPGLRKPSWTPPPWVFGPVWTALYAAMGVAAWLVWRSPGEGRNLALVLFWIQLGLNGLWSFLFFGMRSPGAGFAEICLLWTAVVLTTALFFPLSAWAGTLMVPYAAWVTFAAALNFRVWQLNR